MPNEEVRRLKRKNRGVDQDDKEGRRPGLGATRREEARAKNQRFYQGDEEDRRLGLATTRRSGGSSEKIKG